MINLQRDNVYLGLLAAVLFPVAVWLGLHYMNDHTTVLFGRSFFGFSERFIAILAVCANFLPFFVYMRARKDDSMRGVGIVTMLLAIALVWRYFL